MDKLDILMNDVANNVSAATENVNKILSYSNQLKVQLSRTQELHSRETSIALKQTAENVIHLISNNTKENADNQIDGIQKKAETMGTSFEEFISDAENRVSLQDDILSIVSCVIDK